MKERPRAAHVLAALQLKPAPSAAVQLKADGRPLAAHVARVHVARVAARTPAPAPAAQPKAAPERPGGLAGHVAAAISVRPLGHGSTARAAQAKPAPGARVAATVRPRVVQRMNDEFLDEEGLLPETSEYLNSVAQDFNRAYSGQLESRHTQAVTVDQDSNMFLFTQRYMAEMGNVALVDPLEIPDNSCVIGDQKDDENIHAEMLAISWYLQGHAKLPVHMGISKPVCARCSVVLTHYRIAHYSDGALTKNWTSPWRHANLYPPLALKGRIPEAVKRGKIYQYDDDDWK